ncbi:hypothetical protein PSI19_04900 [Xenorhabdus khoisanae]|uniref:IS66 family insertion sequence element accessory protein TnpA n=1 Tax=Xenorhabdus khoisanae TaxID=880157 RepID=UPI002358BE8F|nr:hypothetical protein [Xenorhabdus khoisanae]MDC9613234.1 hypothetical protein [Xenorhabdus khoisanae]
MSILRDTPREQQQHVTDWQDSDLTHTQYARLHQINSKTFTRWVANGQDESSKNKKAQPTSFNTIALFQA